MRTWLRGLRSPGAGADASLLRQVQELADAVALQERTVEAVEQGHTEAQAGVKAAITRLKTCEVPELRKSVVALGASIRRQAAHSRALDAPLTAQTRAARVLHRLADLGAAGQPIMVGPWTGDMGLELLYWVPFVRWFAVHHRLSSAQLHVVSRGGAPWYGDITDGFTDILSLYSPAEYRARTVMSRQRSFCGFERDIVRRVHQRGQSSLLLHPGLMLRLFTPFWNGDASIEQIVRYTMPRRQPPPAVAIPPLPESFLAMQFAFSRTFEDTPANRAWLDARITSLARWHDVVWLGAGLEGGDAGADPYVPPALPRLHRIDRLLPPEHLVAVQAAIVARASTFIGSYGGLSFVAPFYGVRSVAFYSARDVFPHHRSAAEHLLGGRHRLLLAVINVADAASLGQVLGAAD